MVVECIWVVVAIGVIGYLLSRPDHKADEPSQRSLARQDKRFDEKRPKEKVDRREKLLSLRPRPNDPMAGSPIDLEHPSHKDSENGSQSPSATPTVDSPRKRNDVEIDAGNEIDFSRNREQKEEFAGVGNKPRLEKNDVGFPEAKNEDMGIAEPQAEDLPEVARKAIERAQTLRQRELTRLAEQLKEVSKERIPRSEKLAKQNDLKGRLKDLKTKPLELPAINLTNPTIGSVGKLTDYVRVLQILGERKMLVVPYVEQLETGTFRFGDSPQLVNRAVPAKIIRNFSTNGLADGQETYLKGLFVVSGTESYTAVSGARKTVYTLDLIPGVDVEHLLKFGDGGQTNP